MNIEEDSGQISIDDQVFIIQNNSEQIHIIRKFYKLFLNNNLKIVCVKKCKFIFQNRHVIEKRTHRLLYYCMKHTTKQQEFRQKEYGILPRRMKLGE